MPKGINFGKHSVKETKKFVLIPKEDDVHFFLCLENEVSYVNAVS